MATITRKVPGQAIGFDPWRTVQKIHWASASFIVVVKFIGTGGATVSPDHEPTAFYDFGSDFTDVGEFDNAKQFFKDHVNYEDEESNVARFQTGQTYYFFAAIPANTIGVNVLIDMSACFGSGVGGVQASMKLFKTAPDDSNIDDPDAPFYTFHDLFTDPPTFANQPGATTVSTNRYDSFLLGLKDDDFDPPVVLDPPFISWS